MKIIKISVKPVDLGGKGMAEEIKSTLELALEKAEKIGKASKEELEEFKIKEEARKFAAKFLRDEKLPLKEELVLFLQDKSERLKKVALREILEIFLKNITLPRYDYQVEEGKKVIRRLKELFWQIPQIDEVCFQMEKILEEYYSQLKRVYEELKNRFAENVAGLEKALSQKLGEEVKINVEEHPEFQKEWMKIKEELDKHFEEPLNYFKNLFRKMVG